MGEAVRVTPNAQRVASRTAVPPPPVSSQGGSHPNFAGEGAVPPFPTRRLGGGTSEAVAVAREVSVRERSRHEDGSRDRPATGQAAMHLSSSRPASERPNERSGPVPGGEAARGSRFSRAEVEIDLESSNSSFLAHERGVQQEGEEQKEQLFDAPVRELFTGSEVAPTMGSAEREEQDEGTLEGEVHAATTAAEQDVLRLRRERQRLENEIAAKEAAFVESQIGLAVPYPPEHAAVTQPDAHEQPTERAQPAVRPLQSAECVRPLSRLCLRCTCTVLQ